MHFSNDDSNQPVISHILAVCKMKSIIDELCGTVVFCHCKLALSNSIIVLSVSIVAFVEMNRHYFQTVPQRIFINNFILNIEEQ